MKKSMVKKIALLVMAGSMLSMSSVLANPVPAAAKNGTYDSTTGVITITGVAGNNTYSATDFVGVDGSVASLGTSVTKIQTGTETAGVITQGAIAGDVYGIKVEGKKEDNKTVSVTSITGGINVGSTNKNAYGICLMGDREDESTAKSTISGLGSITATVTDNGGKNAYGIYAAKGESEISFVGIGDTAAQAIIATANDDKKAFSIVAKEKADLTVNFENSILSGKVKAEGKDATLTLNFNDKAVWTPVAGDVAGKVNINVNEGGTIDTRNVGPQGEAKVEKIDLGGGTLTFDEGSTLIVDAKLSSETGRGKDKDKYKGKIEIDSIKIGTATGVVTLADVNFTGTTVDWNNDFDKTNPKEVTLIEGKCKEEGTDLISFTAVTFDCANYAYTFKQSKVEDNALKLNVTQSESLQTLITKDATGKEYVLQSDTKMKVNKEVQNLDELVKDLTINGSDGKGGKYKLIANGMGGVTIAGANKLTVKNTIIDGFDTFATTSDGGEVILDNSTFINSGTADMDNESEDTLTILNTVTLDKGITGPGRLKQEEDSTLAVDPSKVLTTGADTYAIIRGVENGDLLEVAAGNLKFTDTVTKWATYKLVQGDAVANKTLTPKTLWNPITSIDDATGTLSNRLLLAEYVPVGTDTIGLEIRNVLTVVEANTSALAGVQQGAAAMVNQLNDKVADNLTLTQRPVADGKYDKQVWASYINGKETTDDRNLWHLKGNNTAKYRGAIVGADFYTSDKVIAGVAISYAKGDISANTIDSTNVQNDSKYYGVSFYDRVTNGPVALTYDIGYQYGKNDISMRARENITADVDTQAYTAGVRVERAYKVNATSTFAPFASLRYLRLHTKEYKNSNQAKFDANNQNLFIPKLGVAWQGNYLNEKSGWAFKPVAEVGYIFNLGNRSVDGKFTTTTSRVMNPEYDVVDSGTFYGKLGFRVANKNFFVGADYNYLKGSTTKNNRWNVNLGWNF